MVSEQPRLHACDAAVTLAFSVLGKPWNGMILATLGDGQLTFAGLRRTVTGISDAVLSDRLTTLARSGLIVRSVEPGPPVSVTYTLSASGEQLLPLLQQLGQWAAANLEHGPASSGPHAAPSAD